MRTGLFIVVAVLGILPMLGGGCSGGSDQTRSRPSSHHHETASDKGITFSARREGGVYLIDATLGAPGGHRQLGEVLGRWVKANFPGYERLLDRYISLVTENEATYRVFLSRAREMSGRLPSEYLDEIRGFAAAFSGDVPRRGDGRLSADEIVFLNLLGDVARGTACAALGVAGRGTADGRPVGGRNLDWPNPGGILSRLHMALTVRTGQGAVTLIGFLGHFGAITGMNDHGVFGAILDSGTGAAFATLGRRSYFFDLRWALETQKTAAGLAGHMTDPGRRYAYNHNIFSMDPGDVLVVENVVSGPGTRAVRRAGSVLNRGVVWMHPHAVAVVNSFVLKGNPDNHTDSRHNSERWAQMAKALAGVPKVSVQTIRGVMASKHGQHPSTGDVLNDQSLQTVLVFPASRTMELRPDPAGTTPGGPLSLTVAAVSRPEP